MQIRRSNPLRTPRGLTRLLAMAIAALLLLAMTASSAATAATTPVSSLTKFGTDPTTSSTASAGGSAGSTKAGDTINWVLPYTNNTGGPASVNIADTVGSNQTYVQGSLKAPPGMTPEWSTGGGSSWVTTQPSSGVAAVGATGNLPNTGLGGVTSFTPVATPTTGNGASGDGFEDIFYNGNVYNLHHHYYVGESATFTLIDCHVVATGAECPGYNLGGLNGVDASSTAGTPFFSAAGQPATSNFTDMSANWSALNQGNGKLYFATTLTGTANYGIGCLDLSSMTSCGFTQLGTAPAAVSGYSGYIVGGAQLGSKYYLLDYTGTIDCFDISTGTSCGTDGTAYPTGTPLTASQMSAAQLVQWGGSNYAFTSVSSVNSPFVERLSCVDLSTGTRCPGYPITIPASNSMTLVPVLSSSGATTGACSEWFATAGVTATKQFACYDLSGNPIPTPAPYSTLPAGTATSPWPVYAGSTLVVGTKEYFDASTGSSAAVGNPMSYQYQCFDWATNAPCAGFSSPVESAAWASNANSGTNVDLRTYTLVADPYLPGCLAEDGDAGVVQYFNASTGALGCSGLGASLAVNPSASYCDGTSHATAWNQITVTGITAAEYTGAIYTIYDKSGSPVPGYTNVALAPGQTTIDISSIPITGNTSQLSVSMTLSNPTPGATATLSMTFKGTAGAELCFQTKVGASSCNTPPVITNQGNAVTNGGGTATDSPGGNGSGKVSFNEAPDLSSCAPTVSIQKIAAAANGNTTPISVGEKIKYSYLVTNTGNVDLKSLSVNDPTGGAVTCPVPAAPGLAPGDSETCTENTAYTVTQTDVDKGKVTDTATATGVDKYNQTSPQSPPSSTTVKGAPTPKVSIAKYATVTPSADQNGAKVGDSIQFTYKVTNTGNVDLKTVAVSDPTEGAVNCPVPAAPGLAPGASEICTAVATHTVTQADVDAGQVKDTATASGVDNLGQKTPPSNVASAIVPMVKPDPTIALQKIANASAGDQTPISVGETIQYSYFVTNTGNVTLSNLKVADPTGGSVTCPQSTLAPGHSETCKADKVYTVTQADVNTGSVTDTATATGDPPPAPPGNPATPPAVSPPSSVTVPGAPQPLVGINKIGTVTPAADQNALKVGDKITYTYTVTNIGNVDLTSLSVNDPTIGAVTCPAPASPGLAPGASVTCTANNQHTVTQADVDKGKVTDTATATGKDGAGTTSPQSLPSTVTLITVPGAPLTSVKKFAHVLPRKDQKAAKIGDKIRYTYVVTNTGNVDLTTVQVSDPTLGRVSCPVPAAPGLAPGKSVTCVGTRLHTVNSADAKAGRVLDVATSTGVDPLGQVSAISPQGKATEPVAGRLVLQKTASARVVDAGQTVTYTLKVSDPTPTSVHDVVVCDAMPAGLVYVSSQPHPRLRGGQQCWSLGTLKAHRSRTIRVVARALNGISGRVTNHALATGRGVAPARAKQTVRVVPGPGSATPVTG